MANMGRSGSTGAAFHGFSVFQPALGAALQWLPAVGTPELDELINTFLPGPASIQDKRAHISMDFFEYSRQTGESLKFYAVAPATPFTPVATASPATSAVYDSGYGSSFHTSPVLSDQGSWTQSPASFTPVTTFDDFVAASSKAKTVSKKASTSASRQQPVDFSNHPGMRIMTRDGRDITNSASRGSKSKEQRDHAHLMRIIKACDSCKRKKTRCDPSHRKRTASQSSAAAAVEPKSAKKVKKVEQQAPAPLPVQQTDFIISNTFETTDPAALSFSAFDATQISDEEFQSLMNGLVNDEMLSTNYSIDSTFDSFSVSHDFYNTPSISSSATSPSLVFDTPFTPALADSSTFLTSDVTTTTTTTTTAAGDLSVHNPTLPYLSSGVDLGTNYIDFNLYSPASSFYDEDPIFSQQDVASRRYSGQPDGSTGLSSAAQQHVHLCPAGSSPMTDSPVLATPDPDHSDYYYEAERPSEPVQHVPREQQSVLRSTTGASTVPSQASGSSSIFPENDVSTAAAHGLESSVSPNTSPRTRRIESVTSSSSPHQQLPSPPPLTPQTLTGTSTVVQSGVAGSPGITTPQSAMTIGARGVGRHTGEAVASRYDGQHLLQQCHGGLNATGAMMTMVANLPTRRILAGGEGKNGGSLLFSPFSQLVVLGLVSILCGPGSQVPLASRINLLNMLGITILSWSLIALWCCGVPGTTSVASKRLQIPTTPQGVVGNVKAKIQAADRSTGSFRSLASRRGTSVLRSFGTTGSFRF
ncbi:hypothetical protein QBC35DRAFT_178051 [Podospora australis]|uniref:Transcription factor n=1 Tax=Podospora australis TaxID=1536484 RepID=A0AAN7AKN5_9PEZI|nr:hypothetical protein QBC35DRAFT_178051 [Podospora australis]